MNLFELTYLLGFAIATVLRSYYGRQFVSSQITLKEQDHPLVYLGMALWSIVLFLPFFTIFTNGLTFADYPANIALQTLGLLIFIAGLGLLWSTHAALGENFSPILAIHHQHQLVTQGIYQYIRHPMYLSFLMWAVGQALLINNWIAGPLGIIAFLLIYGFRIEREEQQLLETFGDAYRDYQKRSGRLLPKLKKDH